MNYIRKRNESMTSDYLRQVAKTSPNGFSPWTLDLALPPALDTRQTGRNDTRLPIQHLSTPYCLAPLPPLYIPVCSLPFRSNSTPLEKLLNNGTWADVMILMPMVTIVPVVPICRSHTSSPVSKRCPISFSSSFFLVVVVPWWSWSWSWAVWACVAGSLY